MTEYRDESNRRIQLGALLGKGGEGTVYRLADQPTMAAKIYSKALTPDRVQKIKLLSAMSRTGVGTFITCPTGMVLDARGEARGLLLPVVEQAKDIYQLYNVVSRRTAFPSANWNFLVHVAWNVSRAFAATHARNLVIGDVNERLILVRKDGTVHLIDVDSFQVPVAGGSPLLCTVGTLNFTPPELQNSDLQYVVRTANHDAFGLAVIVFLLLMMGRHPFHGVYLGSGEMSQTRLIAESRFAYGIRASTLGMRPPPNTPGLDVLPRSVSDLFERAFAPPQLGSVRPTAANWATALEGLKFNLRTCSANGLHQYARTLAACPWCKLEGSSGVALFGAPTKPFSGGLGDKLEAEFRTVLAAMRAIMAPVKPPLPVASLNLPANPLALEPPLKSVLPNWFNFIPGVLGVAVASTLPGPGILALPIGLLLTFVMLVVRSRPSGSAKWEATYRSAKNEHSSALDSFTQTVSFRHYHELKARADQASLYWSKLPDLEKVKRSNFHAGKRQDQLQRFLRVHDIRSAGIKGIGPGRSQQLSSFGIDTAAEITRSRVLAVGGFGPEMANRLVSWRRELERRFVYNPTQPLSADQTSQLTREMQAERRKVLDDMRKACIKLEAASKTDSEAARKALGRLEAAQKSLAQAEADVKAATGKVPA